MEWTADEDKGNKVVRGASYMVAPGGWYASIQARVPLAADTADPEVGFRCAADAKESP
jgi:formylglycine-generating enzyme required for sulfatase activity